MKTFGRLLFLSILTLSQLHCFFMACKDSVVKCFELNSGPATEGPVCFGHFQFRRSYFSTLMV